MHLTQEWPVILEKAFKRFTDTAPSADAYRSNLNDAIEEGFARLYTLGVITEKEDLKIFLESYTNFQGALSEVITDDNSVFELENLIRQLDNMYKKYVD